ncbi:polyphosphate kinase [Novosphingobium sp. AAP83]|uniref:polyphosphate kinase 2 n=1 Tax=Novosphingobium sp. AAP83 TaxID=1523425 RepID=UPI0006B9E502|nr:polyphosphate kinase 2 [Novosphingobium sp. AAP83]KPF91607.1 polyphosphate kinase [Novosphingobium sp. AAP83]
MSRLKRKEYEASLEPLQRELVDLARWIAATGKRVVVVMEGRDSAGKGGAITAIRQHLNPRQVRTVALAKPTEREAGQWYFQRYVEHLPTAGEMVLFDRSWYNRAGVEKVMGYATQEQVDAFLKAVPRFEDMLVDDGIILLKYWLCCDQEKQEERFAERHDDPLKGWKLSPIDVKAREQYDAYTKAREAMLAATHTAAAPWTLVNFNDQKVGRLTLIRNLIDRIPDHTVAEEKVELPPLKGKPSNESFGVVQPLEDFAG